MGPESLKELVKTHRNAELEKGLKMSKESKWVKDAQEEINGTKKPTSNVIIYIYIKVQNSMSMKPMTILSH